MVFLFKVAYYAASVVSGLLIAGFMLASLFGNPTAGETWRNKAVAAIAGCSGLALLYLAYRFGHLQGQWLTGFGLAILALIVAAILMFGGLLLFTKIHWQ